MCKFKKNNLENIFNELNEMLYNGKKFCYLNNNHLNDIKDFMLNFIIENPEIFFNEKKLNNILNIIKKETGEKYDLEYDLEEILRLYIEYYFDNNIDDFFIDNINSKIIELFRQSVPIFLNNPDINYREYYERIDETLLETL